MNQYCVYLLSGLVVIEDALHTPLTFSALIAIMFTGIGLQQKYSYLY